MVLIGYKLMIGPPFVHDRRSVMELKKIFILVFLSSMLLLNAYGWNWTDNLDGTQTRDDTRTEKRIILEASRLAFGLNTFTCTQTKIDSLECPDTGLGIEFPRLKNIECIDADVTAGRCITLDDVWHVDVIRCGDGSFNSGTGIPPDMDYDKWPGGKVNNSTIYDSACKPKWKNNGWWVPSIPHSKILLTRYYKERMNNIIQGNKGGEQRIINQGNEILEETEG